MLGLPQWLRGFDNRDFIALQKPHGDVTGAFDRHERQFITLGQRDQKQRGREAIVSARIQELAQAVSLGIVAAQDLSMHKAVNGGRFIQVAPCDRIGGVKLRRERAESCEVSVDDCRSEVFGQESLASQIDRIGDGRFGQHDIRLLQRRL